MAVSVATLVARTRIASGLRNNQLFSDDQIAELLSDAYADMRDVLIVRFAGWFSARYAFTLAGGNDGYTLDLSLIPTLESVQGLDFLDSGGNRYTVDELTSIANRNDGAGVWPLASVGLSFNGALGRRYWIDGQTLRLVPPVSAQGNYELIYSPMALPLMLPRVPAWDEDDSVIPPDAHFQIIGADFTASDVGGTLTVAGSGTPGYDGDYEITEFISDTEIVTDPVPPGPLSFPNTTTFTIQVPAGTVGEIPQPLTPWVKYLVLFASVAIRSSRKQDATDLETQRLQIRQRMIDLTKQRGQGVKQAPITRGWRYGGGYGGGG